MAMPQHLHMYSRSCFVGAPVPIGAPVRTSKARRPAPSSMARAAVANRKPTEYKGESVLPAPLTENLLFQAIAELPDGTRRATETCYQCFQDHKFTSEDFMSFLKSISNQSPTLTRAFCMSVGKDVENAMKVKNAGLKTGSMVSCEDYMSGYGKKGMAIKSKVNSLAVQNKNLPTHSSARVNGNTNVEMMEDVESKVEFAVDMTAKLIYRRRKEARRRQLGKFPGSQKEKVNGYLMHVIRKLGSKISSTGKKKLTDSIKMYVEQKLSPEDFKNVLQDLVDEHGIAIELEYTPECETRSSKDQPVKRRGSFVPVLPADYSKRMKLGEAAVPAVELMEDKPKLAAGASAGAGNTLFPSGCPACELDMFGTFSAGGKCMQCGHARAAVLKPLAVTVKKEGSATAPAPASAPLPLPPSGVKGGASPGPRVLSSDLPETALCVFLTQQARSVSPAEKDVRVRVVSESLLTTGGGFAPRYPYRVKSIFAFQKVDGGAEVIFFGMYVHEFGIDAPSPAAGRVYIECLDSIPLFGNDKSADRQRLLTAIVHGYLKFVRSQGFRHVHLRVPPPSAESSHIFAFRTAAVRLEATLRMAQWYKRLLEGAKEAGLITEYESSSHLSRLEYFPPCILPACDLAEEHSFSAMKSTAAKLQQEATDASMLARIVAFKERFFVANLHDTHDDAAIPVLEEDDSSLRLCSVASRRRDFIAACEQDKLSFTTLEGAKAASSFLIRKFSESSSLPYASGNEERMAAGDRCGKKGQHDPGLPEWVQQQQQLLLEGGVEKQEGHVEELESMWSEACVPDVGNFQDAELFADSLFSS